MRTRSISMIHLCALVAPLVLAGPAGADQTSMPQTPDRDDSRTGHHEAPGKDTVHVQPERRITSPGGHYRFGGHVSVQVNVNANGENIVGDAANEPSIAVDPTDRNHMAIGWRQFDTISNNFRQAGWGYTTDAGDTWTFPGVIEAGVFRSDPVLDSDADGVFYYNSRYYRVINGTWYIAPYWGAGWNVTASVPDVSTRTTPAAEGRRSEGKTGV